MGGVGLVFCAVAEDEEDDGEEEDGEEAGGDGE